MATQTLQDCRIAELQKGKDEGPKRRKERSFLQFLLTLLVLGHSGFASAQDSDLDPRIVKLGASISEERLGVILKKLESFETRSSLSSTASTTRGVGAARQWILDEMKGYS